MSEQRDFLIASLRRVIAGGDITNDELAAGIPDAGSLRGADLKAYFGLSYWADDGDIRDKDPTYGPMRRTGLADLLRALCSQT
jgi:hypothetical protein